MLTTEAILEPDLLIIDPHHHLWDMRGRFGADAPPPRHGFEALLRRSPHYLLDQLLADLGAGHNVRATVFVECGAMYRAGAPVATVVRAVLRERTFQLARSLRR